MKHKWVYGGSGGGHRGEYDFTCLRCGGSDWVSGSALNNGEKPNAEGCTGKRPAGTSHGSPEYPPEYARGVADERARVVADLRAEAKALRETRFCACGCEMTLIDALKQRTNGYLNNDQAESLMTVRIGSARTNIEAAELDRRADRYERGEHEREGT